MKSSKIKNISDTSFFSFQTKSSGAIIHAMTFAIFIFTLILALILSFTLSGCESLGNTASRSTDSGYVNDNKENDEYRGQSADDNNGQQQEAEAENDSEEEGQSTETQEGAEETEPSETTEETDAIDPSEQTINVYYSNNTAEYLVGEARTVSGSSKLVDAIYEMMKDPIDSSLFVLIPSTTKINSIKVVNRIAKIDLSQSFMDDRIVSDTVDNLLIYCIVNTLTEFKEIEAVEFYIDGVKLDIFGQLDVKEPVYRRGDLIKSE